MGDFHGPQTQVREGAYAIKVSMRCSVVRTPLIYVSSSAHGPCFRVGDFADNVTRAGDDERLMTPPSSQRLALESNSQSLDCLLALVSSAIIHVRAGCFLLLHKLLEVTRAPHWNAKRFNDNSELHQRLSHASDDHILHFWIL
jgi:hypothetical protein